MRRPRQVVVEDTPQGSAGVQRPSSIGQHGNCWGMVLGCAPVKGRVSNDDADAVVGEIGEPVTPMSDDAKPVRVSSQTSGIDGLPRHVGGVNTGMGKSLCQMGGDDTIPAAKIDDVGVDVGSNVVEMIEEQGRSSVESGGMENATVGSNRQSVHGISARPFPSDGGALSRR